MTKTSREPMNGGVGEEIPALQYYSQEIKDDLNFEVSSDTTGSSRGTPIGLHVCLPPPPSHLNQSSLEPATSTPPGKSTWYSQEAGVV
ncbi:hypothetical protein Pcinc_037877 [Petrolisthes cinctipes]|uniref:Uncharacterized protein n=1 Tax=Petrolisthes cinctipes TaxID=88211 RepID=A0AAE1BUW2_PETCI|nr:hypothetical protein Pcinc_037877 [Petrolisthes cinctipes]